ncbi:MAG: CDP-diacylglycerol--glycerol-3-phosphate 3-phosphatidyltransferase, partial [Gammaproteobacteria bacterium]
MMQLTLPNALTLLRITLIPIMVLAYLIPFSGNHWVAAIVFIIAALTDWLDGYFARTLKQTSAFGAFLDPVADKLLVAVALVLVVSQANLPFLAFPVIIIIGREIAISALREWMSEIGKRA